MPIFLYPKMSDSDIEDVIAVVKKVVKNYSRIEKREDHVFN